MTTDVLGAPIKRVEDPRFITGKGRYLDDITLSGMTYMAILRSPYAHANIRSIDTSAAQGDARRVLVLPAPTCRTTRCRWPGRPVAWRASRTTSTRPAHWPPTASSGPARASRRSSPRRPRRHRRARGDPRRVGAAAGGGRRREGDPAGRAPAPRERPEQRRVRLAGRRQGRHRRGHRLGRGGRPPADRQPAAHPEPDGGPRRHRPLQPGNRRVHGLDVEPDAAHPAPPPDRLRDRDPRAQGPLHLAGRRRGVRDEDLLLRRHGPGDARLEARSAAGRSSGSRPGARTTRARPTVATTSPTSRSPGPARARSPPSGSRRTPTWAAGCRRSARASRRRSTGGSCRAATSSPTSTAR